MATKAELVEQIKGLQRSDPEAKQAWWDYCDSELGGMHDPNRHDSEALQTFLASLGTCAPTVGNSYAGRSSYSTGYSGWEGDTRNGAKDLTQLVKTGQRHSPNWKTAWQAYCAAYGGGINDPSMHEQGFIVQFVDYMGQLMSSELEVELNDGGYHAGGTKRTAPSGGAADYQPPQKRKERYSVDYNHGNDKASLVERVKMVQRRDIESKQSWWDFCDESSGGIRDPARHDAAALKEFLEKCE